MTAKKQSSTIDIIEGKQLARHMTPPSLPAAWPNQLNAYPIAICQLDKNGRFEHINEHCQALLGWEEEGLLGQPLYKHLSPASPTPNQQDFLAHSQTAYTFQHKDERPVTCRLTLLPYQIKDALHYLAFLQPIVEFTSSPYLPAIPETTTHNHIHKQLVEQAGDVILLHAIDGNIQYANPATTLLLGYRAEEVLQLADTLVQLIHPEDRHITRKAHASVKNGQSGVHTFRFKHQEGHYIWLESRVSPLTDTHGKICGFHTFSRDVTTRKEAEEQMQLDLDRLEYLAQHDSLTGLPNRVLFQDRLKQAILQARREQKMVAMLCFDLDRFQRINDTLGRASGDSLLHAVASRLKQCIREGDSLTRPGGDEFAFILPGLNDPQEAVRIAQTLLNSLQKPFVISGHEVFLTASVGISIFPLDGDDLETLLIRAYNAMYQAKEQGKNTFHLYTSAMNVVAFERLAFENSLRRAIEREQLTLYFQPQVEIVESISFDYFSDKPYHATPATTQYKVVGAEALLRWQHPDLGLVSPGRFIPIAEASGLIVPMGEWVLREACKQAKKWQDQGLRDIHISVNLSPSQFQRPNLIEIVASALEESQLDPRYLELEITENIFMHDDEVTRQKMQMLCDMGISIAIDDFGTGYSSLLYLKRFPIQILKIDKSFIMNLSENPNDAAITKGIIAMAHSLDLNVVAEGVQARNQLNYLRSLQCDRIQGYIFSRPIPNDEFVELLKEESLTPHPVSTP